MQIWRWDLETSCTSTQTGYIIRQTASAGARVADFPQVDTEGPWRNNGGLRLLLSPAAPGVTKRSPPLAPEGLISFSLTRAERLTRFHLMVKNGLSLNLMLSINSAPGEKLSHPSETSVAMDDVQTKAEPTLRSHVDALG